MHRWMLKEFELKIENENEINEKETEQKKNAIIIAK